MLSAIYILSIRSLDVEPIWGPTRASNFYAKHSSTHIQSRLKSGEFLSVGDY